MRLTFLGSTDVIEPVREEGVFFCIGGENQQATRNGECNWIRFISDAHVLDLNLWDIAIPVWE